MNEKKLNRAIFCLYGVASTQGALGLYTVLTTLRVRDSIASASVQDSAALLSGFGWGEALTLALWPVAVLAACLFAAQNLRLKKSWAWIASLSIFIFCSLSLCLPFAVLGLLSLVDLEVRHYFIKDLDIQI